MVGTYRDSELPPGHPLPEVLAELERGPELPRVRLAGLDEREVAELIGGDGERRHGRARSTRRPRATRSSSSSSCATSRSRRPAGSATRAARGPARRDRAARWPAAEPGERVLGVAALIGRDFDFELLERSPAYRRTSCSTRSTRRCAAGCSRRWASAPGRYSFVHALLRTTLEEELTATRRARLHRRIGEAMERGLRDTARPVARRARAALRRRRATGGDRAVGYAERAAEQASPAGL